MIPRSILVLFIVFEIFGGNKRGSSLILIWHAIMLTIWKFHNDIIIELWGEHDYSSLLNSLSLGFSGMTRQPFFYLRF